jgi:hypothetical protein
MRLYTRVVNGPLVGQIVSGADGDPWVKLEIRPKTANYRVSEPENHGRKPSTETVKPEIRGYPIRTRTTAIFNYFLAFYKIFIMKIKNSY